ncbi:MAG: radical SAM protein [Dehalococcoidia bacterium]|nr:radical SAM protein [Dehalococcoidia bacterium]
MSEVLFGQSYYLGFDAKLWQAMQPYPPLGAMYAASVLRQRGYDVAMFDAMLAGSEAEWEEALERHQPRYAVLYEDNFNYLSKMCLLRMREAAFTMIGMARAHNCTVVVAGADATDHAELYLAAGANFAVLGEGEQSLAELMDCLTGKSATRGCDNAVLECHHPNLLLFPLKDGVAREQAGTSHFIVSSAPRVMVNVHEISGLAYRDAAPGGGIARTAGRSDIEDLDSLPFPAWDLIDVPRYKDIWRRRHGNFSLNMVTSRGCPFHCSWCAKPIWGQRHHTRTPENVVAEMLWLKETYQPDHISFADDIFGLTPGWIQRFADLVQQQSVGMPFKCLQRADLLLRGDTIPALKRAGAQMVWLGAESGSDRVLKAMDKGILVDQIREAARRLHEAGIEIGFFLQFGYPGEWRADIDETFRMVRDCRPDDIGVSVSYPLPGTPFYNAIKLQPGAKQNWTDSADLDLMYQGSYPAAFYRKLHGILHKEFRSRKVWDDLRQLARRPFSLRKRHLRQGAAMVYYAGTLPFDRRRLRRLEQA